MAAFHLAPSIWESSADRMRVEWNSSQELTARQIFHGDSFTRWLAPSALDKLEWAPADLPAVETIRSALLRGSGGTA